MGRSGASLRRSSVHVVGLRVDVAGREDWERQCEQVIEVRWHIRYIPTWVYTSCSHALLPILGVALR
jgi:hypothetical protein